MIDRSKPLEVCKIEACNLIRHKVKNDNLSVNRALQDISEEAGIPFKTLERWFYPKSQDNYNEKRRDSSLTCEGDLVTNVTNEEALFKAVEDNLVAQAKEITAAKREEKKAERVQERIERDSQFIEQPIPDRKYGVIYADPPWRYDFSATTSRDIENQYPTMELEEIMCLQAIEAADDDSVLFMWATSPKLKEALKVIEAWDFEYKTCAVWCKDKIGMGYYFRQQHELLLVATKGSPIVPDPANRISSIIEADRTKHSTKPDIFYSIIDSMYPNINKLELFSRGNDRPNWTGWGYESE